MVLVNDNLEQIYDLQDISKIIKENDNEDSADQIDKLIPEYIDKKYEKLSKNLEESKDKIIDFICEHSLCHLVAWKSNNEIVIAIYDYDDFDIGLTYKPETEEEFFSVLHELINWMRDHEQDISVYNKLVTNTSDFFPDLGVKRERW